MYSRLAEAPAFLEGVERVIKGIREYRAALMCSEENPKKCRRYLLIGKVLEKRGVAITHIRGDGSLQSQDELCQEDKTNQRPEAFKFESFQQRKGIILFSIIPYGEKLKFNGRRVNNLNELCS